MHADSTDPPDEGNAVNAPLPEFGDGRNRFNVGADPVPFDASVCYARMMLRMREEGFPMRWSGQLLKHPSPWSE